MIWIHEYVCFPISWFFIFFDDLHLQIIKSNSPQSICKEFISQVDYKNTEWQKQISAKNKK